MTTTATAPSETPTAAPPRFIRWEALTKQDFDRIDPARAVVFAACAPIEVHGPHLPMGADALEAEGINDRILRFLPERYRDRTFLRVPTFFLGADTVPQPGSLFYRPETIEAVVEDLGRTL